MAVGDRGARPYYYKSQGSVMSSARSTWAPATMAKQAAEKDAAAKVQAGGRSDCPGRVSGRGWPTSISSPLTLTRAQSADGGNVLLTTGFREHRGEWRYDRD